MLNPALTAFSQRATFASTAHLTAQHALMPPHAPLAPPISFSQDLHVSKRAQATPTAATVSALHAHQIALHVLIPPLAMLAQIVLICQMEHVSVLVQQPTTETV